MPDRQLHLPVTHTAGPLRRQLEAWKRVASVPFRDRLQEFAEFINGQQLPPRRAEQAKSLLLQVQMATEAIEAVCLGRVLEMALDADTSTREYIDAYRTRLDASRRTYLRGTTGHLWGDARRRVSTRSTC